MFCRDSNYDLANVGDLAWTPAADGIYSSSAYAFMVHPGMLQHFPHIPWKLALPPKIKFFLWLLIQDRHLTSANLQERNWPHGDSCVLCNAHLLETADHIFFNCPLSLAIWGDLFPRLNMLPASVKDIPAFIHSHSAHNRDFIITFAAAYMLEHMEGEKQMNLSRGASN